MILCQMDSVNGSVRPDHFDSGNGFRGHVGLDTVLNARHMTTLRHSHLGCERHATGAVGFGRAPALLGVLALNRHSAAAAQAALVALGEKKRSPRSRNAMTEEVTQKEAERPIS